MLRVLAFSAAACVISGLGQLRRAGTVPLAPEIRSYEFDETQGAGIIRSAFTNDIQQKATNVVAQEPIFIEGDGPEAETAIKVPLQALIDGAISVRGTRFRSYSDADAMELPALYELPDFDTNQLVMNERFIVIGYLEKIPAEASA